MILQACPGLALVAQHSVPTPLTPAHARATRSALPQGDPTIVLGGQASTKPQLDTGAGATGGASTHIS